MCSHSHTHTLSLSRPPSLPPALPACLGRLLPSCHSYDLARPAMQALFAPNGRLLRAGDTMRRPKLARTLERVRLTGVSVCLCLCLCSTLSLFAACVTAICLLLVPARSQMRDHRRFIPAKLRKALWMHSHRMKVRPGRGCVCELCEYVSVCVSCVSCVSCVCVVCVSCVCVCVFNVGDSESFECSTPPPRHLTRWLVRQCRAS